MAEGSCSAPQRHPRPSACGRSDVLCREAVMLVSIAESRPAASTRIDLGTRESIGPRVKRSRIITIGASLPAVSKGTQRLDVVCASMSV